MLYFEYACGLFLVWGEGKNCFMAVLGPCMIRRKVLIIRTLILQWLGLLVPRLPAALSAVSSSKPAVACAVS